MAPLTREEIDSIRARYTSATPGPWKASLEGRDHTSGSSCIVTSGETFDLSGATDNDIEFIAHARQDIPRLVNELLKLKGWGA
jgi:hypothetical protein